MEAEKLRAVVGVDLPDDVLAMLGDDSFPNDELAAMANVEASVIAAARLAIANAIAKEALDELSPAPADAVAVEVPAALPTPTPRTRAKTGKPAPAEAPADTAPAVVRVKPGEWWIAAPNGRGKMRIATHDVYSGDLAAHLWQHHRDKVTPYPAR